MLEQLRSALAEISQAYSDSRVHLCQLEITTLEAGRVALAGRVLDAATLASVTARLQDRFPALDFQTQGVQVLQAHGASRLTVVTTVTGLHSQPSFQAELLSQLLNGQTVQLLQMGQQDDRWCFIRLGDGYLGWMYRPYLALVPERESSHLVSAPVCLLSKTAAGIESVAGGNAMLVTRVLGGTAVQVTALDGERAEVELAGGLRGWAPLADLRPLSALPTDEAGRRKQLVADAGRLVGVPYLWGGCTAFGIDCSGFAQLLHRLLGIALPRDADMQFDAGSPVQPPFRPGDLLFFAEGDRRRITHVGMSLGGWRIIHSSRSRNGVYEDDVQAVAHLRESFVGARTFVCE